MFRVGGGGDAGGEKKKKTQTLPLSIECINIKFDSLASSLLPLFSSSCDVRIADIRVSTGVM